MLTKMFKNKKIIILFVLLTTVIVNSALFSNENSRIDETTHITSAEQTKTVDKKISKTKTFIQKQETENKTILDLFNKGGIFMFPLLLLAAFALGFSIERFIFFKKAKLNPIKFTIELEEAIAEKSILDIETLCKNHNYLLSQIVLKGLKVNKLGYEKVEKMLSVAGSIQVSSLEKGLNILSSIGTLAPMIGFLGTTSGMISAFSDIAAADRVSAKIVAGGIEEALLTTAAGLLLAIPTLFSYNYFVHKIDLFVSNIERISSDIVEKLINEDFNEN